jgi:2,3-bisphosphoglycerate-independent phosphoglycerate mutase
VKEFTSNRCPLIVRKAYRNVESMLDMNAGRIRFDYLERLQSSLTRFEERLCAAIAMVSVSLRSVLHISKEGLDQQTRVVDTLDSIIRDCRGFLQ